MRIALYLSLAGLAAGQQAGTTVVEDPTQVEFNFRDCTSGSCSTKNKAITLDANWRWVFDEDKSENCYDGNAWNSDVCADSETGAETCAEKCSLVRPFSLLPPYIFYHKIIKPIFILSSIINHQTIFLLSLPLPSPPTRRASGLWTTTKRPTGSRFTTTRRA